MAIFHSPIEAEAKYPIAVVIPTYNRSNILRKCLDHLEAQTWKNFEVVVVDDGATDDTPQAMEEYKLQCPYQLRYIRQINSGPAAARNRAISIVESPLCLIIGDDILVTPALVETHLQLHREHPETQVAGLGWTRWSEEYQNVTKFMRWLDDSGRQFNYAPLLQGKQPDYHYFYSSNLSAKTWLLRKFPFNETFPFAAWEDTELGCRIQEEHGLEVIFLREALAFHVHPTSVRNACKRMVTVGYSMHHFDELWPNRRIVPPKNRFGCMLEDVAVSQTWILSGLIRFAEFFERSWMPNPILRVAMSTSRLKGYRQYSATENQKRLEKR